MYQIRGCETLTAVPKDDIIAQIKSNLAKYNYQNFTDSNWWRNGARIALVGGGPSLENELGTLSTFKHIMACGSVHDYLIEKGICPTFCILVDPDPLIINYMTLADSAYKIHYLVASQCAPEVFEYLESRDCQISVWHADGSDLNRAEIFGEGTALVGGGCTIGTRAIVLSVGMGFYKQDLFGFDTCLTNTYKHHAYDFHDPNVETLGNIMEIKLGGPDSPTFKVAEYMLAQIFDFQNVLKAFARCIDITVHGGGALAYIMELGKPKDEVIENGSYG